jgi:hypothetical protein
VPPATDHKVVVDGDTQRLVVGGDAQRLGCGFDLAHPDVVARRLGIARGVIVRLALGCSRQLKSLRNIEPNGDLVPGIGNMRDQEYRRLKVLTCMLPAP